MPSVVVVGAGIAGLSAGLALRRAGAVVEVVERAPDGPDRGGAGLYLPGNATRALRRLGLDLDGLGGAVIGRERFCDHRGRVLADVDLASVWDGLRALPGPLHRALRDAAGVPITFGVKADPPVRPHPRPAPRPCATRCCGWPANGSTGANYRPLLAEP